MKNGQAKRFTPKVSMAKRHCTDRYTGVASEQNEQGIPAQPLRGSAL
jgi:hypothetical protein